MTSIEQLLKSLHGLRQEQIHLRDRIKVLERNQERLIRKIESMELHPGHPTISTPERW